MSSFLPVVVIYSLFSFSYCTFLDDDLGIALTFACSSFLYFTASDQVPRLGMVSLWQDLRTPRRTGTLVYRVSASRGMDSASWSQLGLMTGGDGVDSVCAGVPRQALVCSNGGGRRIYIDW
jgi:hypothetical protein